uniref:Mastermind-like protein 2 n=1 Tax=Cyprinus carpio TaxID=7962 RepID=A0A8C2BLJ3_CYPCA
MGEAAPTQATPSGFAPMLGVGMGGSVTPLTTSRGSAIPQLHSAIVERLRARIELCRRHHSTCEHRYVRGQAESSDREHESTLHLLSIVHQGPENRKNKSDRSASQHPPEFNRVNGEHKAHSLSEAESKMSSQIAIFSTSCIQHDRADALVALQACRYLRRNIENTSTRETVSVHITFS